MERAATIATDCGCKADALLTNLDMGDTIMAQMQDVPLSRAVEGESNV